MAQWITDNVMRCINCDDVEDQDVSCNGIPCIGSCDGKNVFASCLRSNGGIESSNDYSTICFKGKNSYGSYAYRTALYKERKHFGLDVVMYTEFTELGRKFMLPDGTKISFEAIEREWDVSEAFVITYSTWVDQIRTIMKFKARLIRNDLCDKVTRMELLKRGEMNWKIKQKVQLPLQQHYVIHQIHQLEPPH